MALASTPSKEISSFIETPNIKTPARQPPSTLDTVFVNNLAGLSAARMNLKPLDTDDDLSFINKGTPKLVPNTPISNRHNSSKKLFGLPKAGSNECRYITREVGKDVNGRPVVWSGAEVTILRNCFNQYTKEGKPLVEILALISRKLGGRRSIRECAWKLRNL